MRTSGGRWRWRQLQAQLAGLPQRLLSTARRLGLGGRPQRAWVGRVTAGELRAAACSSPSPVWGV